MFEKIKILSILVILFFCVNLNAQKIDYKFDILTYDNISSSKKEIDSLLFMCEIFFDSSPDSAIFFCTEAYNEMKKFGENYRAKEIYTNLGILNTYKGNIEQALSFYISGIDFSKTAIDSAEFFTNIANCYVYKSNYNVAFEYFEKSKQIFLTSNYTYGLVNFLINTGVTYSQQGFKKKAMEQYLEALNLYDDSLDAESRGVLYQNLGTLVAEQGDKKKSLEYFNQALEIYEDSNNTPYICDILINIALVNIDEKKYQIADEILTKAFNLSSDTKLENKKAYILFIKGQLEILLKNFDKAIIYFEESLKLRELLGIEYDIIYSYISMAQVYFETKEYQKSKYFAEIALQKSEYLQILELQIEIYKILADNYAITNDFVNAYKYLSSYKSLNDSLIENQQTKTILELEMIYNTEKKHKEIQLLKYEKQLQATELLQKRKNIFIIISISIFIIFFILILQYIFRQREKAEQKKRIMSAAIEAEEKIKDEIAKELHDNIAGRLLGIISYFSSKNTAVNIMTEIKNLYFEIRQLSHYLAEPMFLEVNIIEKLRALVEEIRIKNQINVNFENSISINWLQIKNNQKIQKAIFRITQELINNTLKYSQAKDIEIQLIEIDSNLNYLYNDNGVGFDKSNVKKGIGHENIEKRINSLNGTCEIDSSPNNGITVTLTIPFVKL